MVNAEITNATNQLKTLANGNNTLTKSDFLKLEITDAELTTELAKTIGWENYTHPSNLKDTKFIVTKFYNANHIKVDVHTNSEFVERFFINFDHTSFKNEVSKV